MATSPVPAASPKSALLSAQASLLQSLQKLTLQQNYVPARLPEGKVVGIWGEAIVRLPDGEVRELKIGDMVRKGHVILTSQNGIVQLEVDGSRYARLPAREMLEAPAAGVSGGEDGSLSDSLRIARIAEVVSPAEYEYGFDGSDPYVPFGAVGDIAIGLPTLSVSAPSVREDAGQAVFTVSLSRTTDTATSISLALVNGSAQGGGVDYGSTGTNNLQVSLDGGQTWVDGASVTLPAGVASFLVRTPVVSDALREGDETFVLSATAVAGDVSPVPASGTATIVDDETAPVIQPLPDQTVNEGAGTVTFTITLSGPSEQTISVDYRTVPGTALAGQDYGAITGTLTFAPGETTKTLTVPVIDDTVFEGAETFTLELSNPVNTSVSKPVTTVTIVDDGSGSVPPEVIPTDDTPRVSSVSSPSTVEGGNLDFQVVLSNVSTTPQVVSVVPGSGTATLGTDTSAPLVSFDGGVTFTPITGTTVTVPAGSTSFIVRIPTVDDNISELTETVQLDVRAPGDTAPTTGTGTITDNDGTPTVSISGPAEVGENAGTVTYTITLSNPSSQTVTVRVAAQDGTATVGSDYTQIPADQQLVSFAPGETTRTVTLTVIDDAVFEGKETFSVVLDSPSQAALGTARVTTTISDDGTQGETDDRPTVAINDVVVNEAGNYAEFTVTLTGATALPVNVAFATRDGTALAGTDYTATSGLLTFAPGETTKTIRVPIVNDSPAVYEGAEAFTVELSASADASQPLNARITDPSGTGTIVDDGTGTVNPNPDGSTPTPDDDRPRISINDPAEVNEGDGTNTVTFTVTLSNASDLPVTVAYATANGTALAGSDYVAQNGTLTFAPGQTTATITVTILDDAVYEGPESFSVELSSPTNAVILDGSGIATIKDDGTGTIVDPTPTDPPPASDDDRPRVLAISNAVAAEGSPLDFTVELSNATTPTTATSITLTLSDGSGSIATDTAQQLLVSFDGGTTFTTLSGITSGTAVSISVPAGVTSFLVRVPTTDDTVFEGPETLTLRAATPTDTGAGTLPVIGTGTLYDDGTNKSVNDLVFSGALSEEGLSGGLADATGATTGADTTNATTFNGTLTLSSALTSAGLVLAWSATQAASLQSSATGTALTWTVSADGHTLTGSADGSTILTAVLDNAGAYTVTLSGPVRHAGSGEDTLSFDLGFTATQGSYSASGVATIAVEDDAPATIADQSTSVTLQDTNLLITLDTSGSMLSTLTTGALAGTTRLDAAIAAIKKLLDSYAEFGNVAVQLVTFSDTATAPSSTWMSVSAAKLLLENLTTGGNTNYDAALAAAQAAFSTSGRLTTGQNVAYFFSDGNPTAPSGSIGVSTTEEAAWASFLASQQMNAYAIGMTSDVSASLLDPIAWTTTGGTAASSIIVSDLNQLSGVLQSTVPIPTGDLVTGGEIRGGGQIGADGGFVQSVTIDGISYTLASASARQIVVTDKAGSSSTLPQDGTSTAIFNSTSKLLTVTTEAGGRFIIDMDDGTYEYRVPASVAAKVATEEMRYVVSDKDGDTASATVTVRVNDPSIVGTIGNDSLNGTGDATTPDYILGLGGNDTLSGLGGHDTLVGGTGSDWLTGGAGNDVFAWSLNDQGSKGAPAVDTITDFEIGADILDLRDLLVGEGFGAGNTAGNLANYLDFEVSGTTTTIHVSTTGAFTGGTYSAAAEDQTIVLQNVDLPSALGLASGATDAQIISAMLTQGKLVVDPASGT